MGRVVRRPKSAFVLAAVIAAVAASACFGGPPVPPPPPPPPPPPLPPQVQACESAGAASAEAGKDEPARPSSDQPIPPGEASAQARDASSTTDVRTKDGEIPLVTVEERGGRPEVTSTPVDSPDEAAAVAEEKAADGDLVAIDVDRPVKASTNDPRFGEQWALTQVPFVEAWATDGTQGGGVTVAVVDTGVQQSHPDLAGQVLGGHLFLHDNSGGTPFEGSGGTSDPSGHGTHVAGSVAALSGNQIGVSGAAPGVDILPVQVLCEDGVGFSSDVASGIIWAVDNGADVINLSLGGGPTNAEQSAVEYADQQNVVVVAAGGNDGTGGSPSYPASYSLLQPNVIAVAATTNATPPGHPSYGTTGSYLDLSAPGGVNGTSSVAMLSTVPPNGYDTKAGTSMATPHVSAAAALLIAAAGCSDNQVKGRLIATAVDLGSPGKDALFGHGLVNPNAAAALCT